MTGDGRNRTHTISVQLLGQKGKTGYCNLGLLGPKWDPKDGSATDNVTNDSLGWTQTGQTEGELPGVLYPEVGDGKEWLFLTNRNHFRSFWGILILGFCLSPSNPSAYPSCT